MFGAIGTAFSAGQGLGLFGGGSRQDTGYSSHPRGAGFSVKPGTSSRNFPKSWINDGATVLEISDTRNTFLVRPSGEVRQLETGQILAVRDAQLQGNAAPPVGQNFTGGPSTASSQFAGGPSFVDTVNLAVTEAIERDSVRRAQRMRSSLDREAPAPDTRIAADRSGRRSNVRDRGQAAGEGSSGDSNAGTGLAIGGGTLFLIGIGVFLAFRSG